MSKTKWYSRALYLAIALALAVSLAGIAAVSADPARESEWDDVSTPSLDDLVILPGSDIVDFDMGPDGEVIYAVVNGDTLLKSEDSGATWSDITKELPSGAEDLKLVSVAPDNADFVVVATETEVYGSNEGGDDFEDTGFPTSGISCLDVSCEVDDEYNIAVGTDAGKIYRFKSGAYWPVVWKDTTTYDGWDDYCAGSELIEITGNVGCDVTKSWNSEEVTWDYTFSSTNPNGDKYTLGLAISLDGVTPDFQVWIDDTDLVWKYAPHDGTSWIGTTTVLPGGITVSPVTEPHKGKTKSITISVDLLGGTGATFWWATQVRTNVMTWYPSTADWGADASKYAKNDMGGTKAVTSVAFSPNFDADDTILAITTNGFATYLQTGRWDTKEWNDEAGDPFPPAVKIADEEAVSSGIAIPSDYDGLDSYLRKVFAYVNTVDTGYLQRIDSSKVHPCRDREFGFCPDADGTDLFASLAYHGTGIGGKFMLGAKDSNQVWRAEDMDFCCPEWFGASKPPTGEEGTLVAFTPDGKKGYAATTGEESAFSVSLDDGKCWNQLSLIDTNITSLSDVAVSPDCGTTLLFSVNSGGCDSVWFKAEDLPEATEYSGVWLRVWCDLLEGSPETGLIRLAPEEAERVFTVYLVDRGTDNIWHNDSSGITKWLDRHCTRIEKITDLAVESESIIYALGDSDLVSKSTNNGRKWASAVDAEVDDGHTIAALGDYVLVGGTNGDCSYSDDAGDGFTALDDAGEVAVHVAFDSYFEDNGVVYAASDSIYRCSDLEEGEWTNFKSNYGPDGEDDEGDDDDIDAFYGIVLDNAAGNPMTDEDTGGVLYAVYEDGMARVLGAADSKTEDYLDNGAPDGEAFLVEPSALRICGCLTKDSNSLLWAINLADSRDNHSYDLEDGNDNLFVYEDCLAKAGVELSKVKDEAVIASDPCECWNDKFVLNWDDLCNSSTYELQIALDEDFDFTVKLGDLAKPDDEFVLIPDDTLDCNETYYWRVRVIKADSDAEVIRSWWSDAWSFTVQAGPMGAIQLTAPDSGATDVAIEGVAFTWTSVSAATSYDFALMDAAGNVVSSETGLTGTAYACPEELSYGATYTWKVTAMKDGFVLSESSLSTFRTVPAAAFTCPQCGLSFPSEAALRTHVDEVHAPVEPTTPSWVWVVIGLGAVLVITILVLIFRTRRI